MRHRNTGRKLGRNSPHRKAMVRNMVTSLFEHERIVTTAPKAKEVRKIADKMISLAKRDNLHARRQALACIRSSRIVTKLFDKLKSEFSDRQGGYTRIIKTGNRNGDAAQMAILELVNYRQENCVAVGS